MNVRMWEHKTNKENIKRLNEFGYRFIGPEIGDMACGEYGEGKMSEPEKIFDTLDKYFKNIEDNKRKKVLVTAGPTRENIDPVRFISNYSSGKQGYEIARAFSENGFETTLITGPTNLKIPENVRCIEVISGDQMLNETIKNLPVDIAVFTAAVSDFKIKSYSDNKIKKTENLKLSLEKNIDILSYEAKHNSLRPKIVIGMAAETNDLEINS
jgi:Phosphopantothenoylcysteine synthetase/decarboxylase